MSLGINRRGGGAGGFDIVVWCEATPGTGLVGVARALADQRYAETDGDNVRVKHVAPYLGALWYAATSTPAEARIRQTSRLQDLQFLKACDFDFQQFTQREFIYVNIFAMRVRGECDQGTE